MLSAALTHALTTPAFVAADFVPTQWDAAEQKAKFANALLTFVAQDFPRSKFHESFYRRLSNMFGHIAHYDSVGFCGRFFLTAADKLEFLEQCVTWPCHGDPTYTYSDVERAVGARLRSAKIVTLMRSQVSAARRQADLALLAELKARYEPIPHAPTPGVPDGSLLLFDTRKGAA
jgi:hypothetical protein